MTRREHPMGDEPPEGTGYHSLDDDDEEDEFDDHDPTLADCIHMLRAG